MTPKEAHYLLVDGKKIHYDTLHTNLRRKYGKATKCDFCNTKDASRYEWALLKNHSYSMNISDYVPLCPSCHRKYDMTEEAKLKMSKSKIGKYLNENNPSARKLINTETGEIFNTIKEVLPLVNLKRTTFQAMLNNQNPNKTKFKYYE